MGFITTFAYDTRGNLIKTTNAEGEVTSLAYTPHGQLASIKDALGRPHRTLTLQEDPGEVIHSDTAYAPSEYAHARLSEFSIDDGKFTITVPYLQRRF